MELLSHPLFITLLSVIVGTGILGYLNYRRTRRDTIRDKSLDFLNEVSSALNLPMSKLFHVIRSCNKNVPNNLWQESGALFTKRLNVRVKSRSLLKNPNFFQAYDELVWEIKHLLKSIESLSDENEQNLKNEIIKHLSELEQNWKIQIKESKEELPSPYHEFMNWVQLIWDRIDEVLSDEISQVLNRGLWN